MRKDHGISFWGIIAWRQESHALARGKALILVMSFRLTILLLGLELEWRNRGWILTLLIVAHMARGEGPGADVAHLIQAPEVVIRRVWVLSSLLFISPEWWHQISVLLLALPLSQASLILMLLLVRHELLRHHRVIDRGYL